MFLQKMTSLKFKLSSFFVIAFLAFAPVMITVTTTPAKAQNATTNKTSGIGADTEGGPFKNLIIRAKSIFKSVRTVVFLLGGFGLIFLAAQAIFGDLKWDSFLALAIGLLILGVAGYLVDYITQEDTTKTMFGDDLSTLKGK